MSGSAAAACGSSSTHPARPASGPGVEAREPTTFVLLETDRNTVVRASTTVIHSMIDCWSWLIKRVTPRRIAIICMLPLMFSVGGCGIGGDDDRNSAQDRRIARLERSVRYARSQIVVMRRRLAEQGGTLATQQGEIARQKQELARRIASLLSKARSHTNYVTILQSYENSINDFWRTEMQKTYGRSDYRKPEIRGRYDPTKEQYCGGESFTLPGNAFYCPSSDYIAWDENGLMYRLYQKAGGAAPGLILAHEWGHAIQTRLRDGSEGIQRELGADCLAGAWAKSATAAGDLSRSDFVTALKAMLEVGDPKALEWTDPDAHGNAFERDTAFRKGLDGGAAACVPPAGAGSP
jgi:predicted metalloprotease